MRLRYRLDGRGVRCVRTQLLWRGMRPVPKLWQPRHVCRRRVPVRERLEWHGVRRMRVQPLRQLVLRLPDVRVRQVQRWPQQHGHVRMQRWGLRADVRNLQLRVHGLGVQPVRGQPLRTYVRALPCVRQRRLQQRDLWHGSLHLQRGLGRRLL